MKTLQTYAIYPHKCPPHCHWLQTCESKGLQILIEKMKLTPKEIQKYNEVLPIIVEALDFHITPNMRAVYYLLTADEITIKILLVTKPFERDNFLISDIEGLIGSHNLFKVVTTEIIVDSETPLYEIGIEGFRVFARNEDDEDDN